MISNGVDPFFSPPPADEGPEPTRQRFSNGRPYVLHLGTLEPRKGVITLIEAWERLHQSLGRRLPDLVLAGMPGWGTAPMLRRIAASPQGARIHRPGYVSREHARDLLRHAEVFVLASETEGYGLPLAEALSCGTPSVASDIPPLREVGGDAVLHAPVGDAATLAEAISAALEPRQARSLRCRALVRARSLRWEPAISAWQKLLGGLGGVSG
jgi:glycosyltransferase involved in cell wall biosynthesis